VLAYELSHADRMLQGTSLVDMVCRVSAGSTYTTMVHIKHIEMVGLTSLQWTCKNPDVIMRNTIRGEHNMAGRCNY